jgi:hypothetical protein
VLRMSFQTQCWIIDRLLADKMPKTKNQKNNPRNIFERYSKGYEVKDKSVCSGMPLVFGEGNANVGMRKARKRLAGVKGRDGEGNAVL